jgi:hypothetical protein
MKKEKEKEMMIDLIDQLLETREQRPTYGVLFPWLPFEFNVL